MTPALFRICVSFLSLFSYKVENVDKVCSVFYVTQMEHIAERMLQPLSGVEIRTVQGLMTKVHSVVTGMMSCFATHNKT